MNLTLISAEFAENLKPKAMNKILKLSGLALLFAILPILSSRAQADQELKSRYNLKHVIVELADGSRIKGKLFQIFPDSVIMISKKFKRVVCKLSSIKSIHLHKKGAGAIGAFVGAGLAFGSVFLSPYNGSGIGDLRALEGIFLAPFGATLGSLIGSQLNRTYHINGQQEKYALFVQKVYKRSTVNREYKEFKMGLGIGYGAGSSGSDGILLSIEPGYHLLDNFSIGLKLEKWQSINSYTINGQYYFGSGNKFRPFVGAGLGIFNSPFGFTSYNCGANCFSGIFTGFGTKFGFYPRVGFDFGKFNMALDYSQIISGESYFGIRVGGFLTGGKKKSFEQK